MVDIDIALDWNFRW